MSVARDVDTPGVTTSDGGESWPRRYLRAHGPLGAAVAAAIVWTGLALRSPTTTYHLFPAAVGVAWPLTARKLRGRESGWPAIRAAAGGLMVALAATAVLASRDALGGPALVGGSAAGESMLVAVLGTVWGVWHLVRRRSWSTGAAPPLQ